MSLWSDLGIYASPKIRVFTLLSWPKASLFPVYQQRVCFTERRSEQEKSILSQTWWHTSLIPADLSGFEASLVYTASSRTARDVTQRNTILKNKIKQSKRQKRKRKHYLSNFGELVQSEGMGRHQTFLRV